MNEMRPPDVPTEPSFIGRLLTVVLVGALLLAVYQLTMVFIIGFGGIIFAVAVNNVAVPLQKWLRLPHHLALALAMLVFLALVVGFFAVYGTQTAVQFTALAARLPQAWVDTRAWLDTWPVGRWLLSLVDSASDGAGTTLLSALPIAGGVFGGIANLLLIMVVGLYLAADANVYIHGALRLLPPERRIRAMHILDEAGADLRKWMIAMTLDMLFYGIITGAGLWLVGAPFPFPLAVLAGVSVFVPYIGPLVAMVPGILLALSVDPQLALYAGIVYLIAHELEVNVSLPLLQRWTVKMPPAVSMLAIVGFGLLFGFWGVLLATPMAVVTMTVVRLAYVEDFLEKRSR